MKRQHGQTLVEFALMAPLMFLLIFGMIYGGTMFMQYLDFSNNARQIAREVSVLDNVDNRDDIVNKYGAETEFTRFYTAKRTISYSYEKKTVTNGDGTTTEEDDTNKPVDVIVTVTFERDNKDLPWILYKVGFPPEKINPIVYRMRLEQKPTDDTSSNEDSSSDEDSSES